MTAYFFGIDNIAAIRKILNGKRVALLTNPSGINSFYRSSASILMEEFKITAFLGPEHGIKGNLQAGHTDKDALDVAIPEFNLHGCSTPLIKEHFELFDILVFDIQDIGSRFYTYLYTFLRAMDDCAGQGVPVLVLDRPNPLGGVAVEGCSMREKYQCSLGRSPLPVRHGLTAGEITLMVNALTGSKADVTVVPCGGLKRKTMFCDSGRSWLNPSPNMQSMDCALIYNGTCFFEGTNISEGRGTTRPYEIIGAPFLNNEEIVNMLNSRKLPGVVYRACYYTPTFSKYKDELCHGIQIHITDHIAFNGFEAGMALWYAIRETTPEFEINDKSHVDTLFGDDSLTEAKESLDELFTRAHKESAEFKRTSKEYYLYKN